MELTIKISSKEQGKYSSEFSVQGNSAEIASALTFPLVDTIKSILDKLQWSSEESTRFVANAIVWEIERKILKKEDKTADAMIALLWGLGGMLDLIEKKKI